jgi:enoyl-CoA hydratase
VSYEALLVNVKDGVGSVTLNRPEARNALNATLIRELEQALTELEIDPAARVIVLAGAGDRAFCAGADLKGVADRGTSLQARESFGGLARILAADDSVFGLPEIKIGLLPLIVMAPILRSVGRKRGMLMILSGEQVSAREAYEMGLVSRLVARAELSPAVDALARTLADLSPTALGLAKEAAATVTGMEYGASLRYLREMLTLVALSEDAREGIKAFFEKRAPNWTGR